MIIINYSHIIYYTTALLTFVGKKWHALHPSKKKNHYYYCHILLIISIITYMYKFIIGVLTARRVTNHLTAASSCRPLQLLIFIVN